MSSPNRCREGEPCSMECLFAQRHGLSLSCTEARLLAKVGNMAIVVMLLILALLFITKDR